MGPNISRRRAEWKSRRWVASGAEFRNQGGGLQVGPNIEIKVADRRAEYIKVVGRIEIKGPDIEIKVVGRRWDQVVRASGGV